MSNSTEANPILNADFDGTCVQLADRKISLQNAKKSPLQIADGLLEFFGGVAGTGVEFGDILTRRKAWLREGVTRRTIAELGISKYFGLTSQVRMLGNERGKADALVAQSMRGAAPGIIEDRPHKLLPELLKSMRRMDLAVPGTIRPPIVVGLVGGGRAHSSYHAFLDDMGHGRIPHVGYVAHDAVVLDGVDYDGSFVPRYDSANQNLYVVALDPFSEESGVRFGLTLQRIAEAGYQRQSTV